MYNNCLYGEPYEENSTGCHIVDERNERIEKLEQALNEIRKLCNEWIYGNEDFCINTNEKILQIIDKVGVNE